MAGIIYDTSIYITSLRSKDTAIFQQRRVGRTAIESVPLWLSAVVLEELYVGANNRSLKKLLLKLEKNFEKADRLLVPIQSDWTIGGQVLAQIGQKYGFEEVRRARMTNDALIAMTAARNGFTVITKNAEDFRKIAEFRFFSWEEI